MNIIGRLNPYSRAAITEIMSKSNSELPDDYVRFLTTYGDGNINERLYFHNPDPEFIQKNFKDDLDLWKLTDEQKESILKSIKIGQTIDGDLFCLITGNSPWLILPRNDEHPVLKNTLDELISYYTGKNYIGDKSVHFDPDYQSTIESFSLVKLNSLDQMLLEKIHHDFTKHYSFDAVINIDTQPKYILQNIGGWLSFDRVYKNLIRLKYQKQFEKEAYRYRNFIKSNL